MTSCVNGVRPSLAVLFGAITGMFCFAFVFVGVVLFCTVCEDNWFVFSEFWVLFFTTCAVLLERSFFGFRLYHIDNNPIERIPTIAILPNQERPPLALGSFLESASQALGS